MPLHHRENQYRGVNAHLHSIFQREEGWRSFHNTHIADLQRALQAVLPLESGYAVVSEDSLQIGYYDIIDDHERRSLIVPDVTVWQRQPGATPSATGLAAATPTTVLQMDAERDEPEEMLSLVIRELIDKRRLGRAITRLEVLSPANLPGGSYFERYVQKRQETLLSGVHLLELDYLHERPSPWTRLPDYTRGEVGAYPYTILVSRMQGEGKHSETQVYGFRVDDPIPNIALPLAEDDAIVFSFNAVYQQTFRGNNLYGQVYVDYEREPEGLDTYSADDQARIRQVMARAAEETL